MRIQKFIVGAIIIGKGETAHGHHQNEKYVQDWETDIYEAEHKSLSQTNQIQKSSDSKRVQAGRLRWIQDRETDESSVAEG